MNNNHKNFLRKQKNNKGFTLVELIVVISVLGIISAIAIPRYVSYRDMAKKIVCETNRKSIEKSYTLFLLNNGHNDVVFNQFIIEDFDKICLKKELLLMKREK